MANSSCVLAWGFGGFGGLATGDSKNQPEPVIVPALGELDVAMISMAVWHSAIVTVSGELYTCGYGRYGSLGQGHSNENRLLPTRVNIASKKFVDAACGQYHTLAVTNDGELWSFGFGIGRGFGNNELDGTPRQVMSVQSVIQASAGTYHSACVTRSGAVFVWGIRSRKPVQLPLPSDKTAVFVSCGSRHTAVLTQDGHIFSFFLPMSPTASDPNGVKISRLHSSDFELIAPIGQHWTKLSTGHGFTVAATNQNEIYTFGRFPPGGFVTDYATEYQDDDVEDVSDQPISRLQWPPSHHATGGIVALAAGSSSIVVLAEDKRLYVVGSNVNNNLGLGHNKPEKALVPIPSLISQSPIQKVFVGGQQGIAKSETLLSGDLRKLHAEALFCDVRLGPALDDQGNAIALSDVPVQSFVPAHMFILSVRCPALRGRLTELQNERKPDDPEVPILILEGVRLSWLPYVVEFLYNNSVTLPHNLMHLCAAISKVLTKLIFPKQPPSGTAISVFGSTVTGSHNDMERNLNELFESTTTTTTNGNSSFSDLTFLIESQTDSIDAVDESIRFPSHRALLSARAPYFKAMFSMGLIETHQREIRFQDATRLAFITFLRFVYTGKTHIPADVSVELLELGVRLNWPLLRILAEKVILQQITLLAQEKRQTCSSAVAQTSSSPDDVFVNANMLCSLIGVSEYCDAPAIRNACIEVIASHHLDLPPNAAERELYKKLDESVQAEIQASMASIKEAREKQKNTGKKEAQRQHEHRQIAQQRRQQAQQEQQSSANLAQRVRNFVGRFF